MEQQKIPVENFFWFKLVSMVEEKAVAASNKLGGGLCLWGVGLLSELLLSVERWNGKLFESYREGTAKI